MRRLFLTIVTPALVLACAPPPSGGDKEAKGAEPAGESGKTADEVDIGEAVVDESSTDPRQNPMAKPDFGAKGEPTWDPGKPEGTGTVLAAGWSKDGEEFGWCAPMPSGCTACEFMGMDRSSEKLNDCEEGSDEPDPALTKTINDRLAEREYGDHGGPWFFADHLTLVWSADAGDRGSMQPARLRIGAQVKTSQLPVFSMVVTQPDYEEIEPAYIGLSPDGKYMGAVARSPGPEGADDVYKIQAVPVHELANKAFNGAAMLLHRGEDYEKAIDLYHFAAMVQPQDANAMYNLACALAKTEAPSTRAALEEAVNRGAKYVRKKMKSDADLDGVREEAWFKALLEGED